MLYDIIRVDHRNSENLEERETVMIIALSLQVSRATPYSARNFGRFSDLMI